MKRLIVLFLCMALCCMTPFSVYASQGNIESDSENDSYNMTVTYSVDNDYLVVIPEKAELDSEIAIFASKINIEPDKVVRVRIGEGLNDKGEVFLDRDKDDSDYGVTALISIKGKDDVLGSNTVIASFSENNADPVELSIGKAKAPDKNDVKAGSYTGCLTFSISCETEVLR